MNLVGLIPQRSVFPPLKISWPYIDYKSRANGNTGERGLKFMEMNRIYDHGSRFGTWEGCDGLQRHSAFLGLNSP